MRSWRKGEQGRIDRRGVARFATAVLITFILAATPAGAQLRLYEEEVVQEGAADLGVYSYSVPSYVDWDNDGLKDLIVGERTSIGGGKVRIYLNVGTTTEPAFNGYVYAQSGASDLGWDVGLCPCIGCFPRVVDWNGDGLKDLMVSGSLGEIKIFLNTNTDADPTFDAGTNLQIGPAGGKVDIYSYRMTSMVVDWNNDGKKDVVAGAKDSKIHIFINEGTDNSPDFLTETFAQMDGGGDLMVLSDRSSPDVLDLDFDGKKDIVSGNTNCQLLFYKNTGTDAAPVFANYELVEAAGVDIDLLVTRSQPAICDWTGDGYLDVLIGAGDGKVRLYQGVIAGDMDYDRDVDLSDFAAFADYWLEPDCGVCSGAELTHDGSVELDDLQAFVVNWLYGTE